MVPDGRFLSRLGKMPPWVSKKTKKVNVAMDITSTEKLEDVQYI